MCAEIRRKKVEEGPAVFSSKDYLFFTIEAFLTRPVAWIVHKTPVFIKYWFGTSIIENSIIAILAAGFVVILLVRFNRPVIWANAFFMSSVVAGTLAPVVILHFEMRYLYLMKFMFILVFVLSAIFAFGRRSNERTVETDLDVAEGDVPISVGNG